MNKYISDILILTGLILAPCTFCAAADSSPELITASPVTADAVTADALIADAVTANALTEDALIADAVTEDSLPADSLTANLQGKADSLTPLREILLPPAHEVSASPFVIPAPVRPDRLAPISSSPLTQLEKYARKRRRIRKGRMWIPDNFIFQYAGSIGICSMGAGWEYGRRHWETALLFGIVPKAYKRPAMVSLTLKQQYTPWSIRLPKNFRFQPLHCGLFVNSILNEHFWGSEPDKYPNGYYGFSTKIRFHIFLSESLSYKLPDCIKFGNEVSVYYELSTCDLYVISAATNHYLKPRDYLSLAFGMKWHF